jgi:hypothetical protein
MGQQLALSAGRPNTWIDTLNPFFCNWIAGFTDGEGCFMISIDKRRSTFRCRFHLELRSDDKCILQQIVKELGIGIAQPSKRKQKNEKTKPAFRYIIQNKESCLKLCELFSHYQLRSKKANDFLIWREAVYEWVNHKPGDSWDKMAALCEELIRSRNYIEV